MGSDQSKPSPQQQQQQQEALRLAKEKKAEEQRVTKKIQAEKIGNNLDQNIQLFDSKQKKYEAKIEVMKSKAKELLEQGKQKQAKKILEEATRLKKQLESIQTRRKVIENKKFDIEVHEMNKETIDALEVANDFTKEDYSEKLNDHMITAQQQKMVSKEINQKMKEMVDDDEQLQAADDMLKELEAEVAKEKKKNIAKKDVQVQVSKNIQTNKKQTTSEDIDALLNSL